MRRIDGVRKQNNGVGGEKMGRKEEGFNAPPANGRQKAGTLLQCTTHGGLQREVVVLYIE